MSETDAAVIRTVALTTELPLPADTTWQAMQQPATFLYVVRGLLAFPAVDQQQRKIETEERGTPSPSDDFLTSRTHQHPSGRKRITCPDR